MVFPDKKLADRRKSAAHQKCRRKKKECSEKKLDDGSNEEIIAGQGKNSGVDKQIGFEQGKIGQGEESNSKLQPAVHHDGRGITRQYASPEKTARRYAEKKNGNHGG